MSWFERAAARPRRERFLVFGEPDIRPEDEQEVLDCLRSRWIGQGPRVERFEERFRLYQGAEHAVAVCSCTAAMHLALLAAGVGPGDEVITSPLTFCATANVILHVGATPVFADVDPRTWNLDPAQVERALTPRTKALLPVHFAGRPAPMSELMALAGQRGVSVIVDAAHAIESEIGGRRAGVLGDAVAFSFYVTKNLTTVEGGMLTTARAAWAEEWRRMRLHGLSRDAWKRYSSEADGRYECVAPGYKYNMTDLEAALGLSQLGRIDAMARRREEIWARYDEALADLPLELPAAAAPGERHARHLYTVLVDLARAPLDRDALQRELKARNIGTGIHFHAVHLHSFYRERFGYRPEDFPVAASISQRTLSLPLGSALGEEDLLDVVGSLRALLLG